MSSNNEVSALTGERVTGCVKWFNNKAGYGFVTILSGEKTGDDIFVHHSSISIKGSHYKYLVQGEYVQFSLTSVESGDHKHQAQSISGISGGALLCETRNESRASAPKRPISRRSTDSRPQYRGAGPRERRDGDNEEWVLTRRKTNTSNRRPRSSEASK